ncbi:MAG: SGNH/GDSL hydrolase family protein [Nitrospirota bacterium]|nr:SGNH/GDSL hydrolase family protein [Nitrospirota bacterium]
MKDSFSTTEKIVLATGVFFIIAGVISNEWLLALIFSPDGNLRANTRIAIGVIDIFLITTGFTFVFFAKKRQVMNLAVLVVTLLICFIAAEGVLRLIEPKPARIQGLLTENPNETGSYLVKPDANIVTKLGSKEIVIKTNSDGMWWKEVSRENPLKKTRIAFVGDSFTFGVWADTPEKTLVGVFDSQMNPEEYEVLNFGVPGVGPPDIELQLRERVLAFKPDYVILVFYNGNDFRDAYFGMNKYKMVDGIAVWNDSVEKKIIPEAFRKKTSVKDYLKKSAIFRRFDRLISMHLAGNRRSEAGFDFSASKLFGAQSFWSTKDYPEVALKARDLALRDLDNIRKVVSEHNIQLVIVAIPYEEQVYAASLTGKDYDVTLPQKYVREFAKAHSIPYLDMLPILRSYVRQETEDIYVPNDIHFNNNGHYIVGKAIADFFKGRFMQ